MSVDSEFGVAADCVYSPETATALVKTVRTALKPGGLALVVCAETRVRFGSEPFAGIPPEIEFCQRCEGAMQRVHLVPPYGGSGWYLKAAQQQRENMLR